MEKADYIRIQHDDFDINSEYQAIRNNNREDGAIVFFVGQVREMNQGSEVTGLYLEHYPAMTEKSLQGIVDETRQRWPEINHIRLIHRVGQLAISDQIVFVAASSSHRESAFSACHFIMDFLKNRAPFWKKETLTEGERWVEALEKDKEALKKW
jgi:molybdopterin synthase catalytic subunit